MKKGLKALSIVLLLSIVITMALPLTFVSAANFSGGNGTAASPYLVTTVEQLQGIRDNLAGHYKLANTIDLKGVDFKPIGRLDIPFTGSFTCELNSDNTPKFVIKNLTQKIKNTAYAAEKKNKWESGLFGATKGAKITGIYVLNASVNNQILGDNRGAVQYNNYKPGMDEMTGAILIGDAQNTTVKNCGTTGKITGKASGCGGLIGRADACTVTNCYTTASVDTLGKWAIGGLLGSANNSTVVSCFATGDVKGGQSNTASFIGGITSTTITDCYATGDATTTKEDCSNFTTLRSSGGSKITNCYATGNAKKVTKNTEGKTTVKNCYTLSGKKSYMTGFKEATMATIKSKIKGANWNSAGSKPELKNIGVVTNASKYVPQAAASGSANGGASGSASAGGAATENGAAADGTTEGQTVVQGTLNNDQADIDACNKIIDELPNPDEENAITIEHKAKIMEAYTLYNGLSASSKENFDANKFSKLMNARYQVSLLMATDIVTRIEALPPYEELTYDNISEINALWAEYEFLDEKLKEEFDDVYVNKLTKAHEYALENAGKTQVSVDEKFSDWQLIIIGACVMLVIFAIIFNIIAGIYFFKRSKKAKVLYDELLDELLEEESGETAEEV